MDFTGKTAIVTGGSRGIGRAVCLELAKGGANVVLCYAGNAAAAEETVSACTAAGGCALAVQCDITDSAQVKTLTDTAMGEFGRIDILVNNAGITRDGLLMMMKETDFDAVVNTNLRGAFLCMKAVARQMVKQRWGRIVNLSSVVGLRGNAGQANYAASKAGVIGMTKSLAKELAGRGITVNAVAPGFIDTDMTAAMPETARSAVLSAVPAGRLGAAEEVAKAVAFLASGDAAYITGQVLAVDGGMAM
jgi:3-oxoacyl-[acyl-carrier protein] reductase